MAQSDEFDLRELLGDTESGLTVPDINEIAPMTPASELAEVESTLRSVQCWRCACFMVGMINDKRVCRYHKDHPNDANCSDCARRTLINSPGYIAQGHATEKLAHPVAPNVTAEGSNDSGAVVSPVKSDPDVEVTIPGVERDELDREYYECFNATMQECKDLEPEKLQEIRHRHLRMIRRAKIMNQAIRVLEEGKLQLVDAKRRKKILDEDADFMKRRAREQKAAEAAGGSTTKKSSTTGMSAAEKQIRQFCKLNMPDEAIISTLKAVGTGVPENVAELIAKHRK